MTNGVPSPTARRVSLGPVLMVNFIGTLGFSIVLPFLVFLVTRFGGNALVYGLVGATYPAFQFIGAPILGRWSDRYGRKRILLLSQAGTLLSWIIFSAALFLPMTVLWTVRSSILGEFTVTLPLLVIVIARALDGLTGGNISVANAYVADVSTDEDRNRNFGRMGVASNLGMILGPAAASVLGATAWGEILPVFGAAIISLVATIVIATSLPESNPCGFQHSLNRRAGAALGQEPRNCLAAGRSSDQGVRTALAQPNILYILVLYFVILLSFNFYYAAFPMHAATNLRWTVVETGIFFAVLSLLMVVVQGPLLSRLSRHVSEARLVLFGCLMLGTNFLFMQSSRVDLIYVGAAFFALGNGLMWPSLVALVAKVAGSRFQGITQGLAGSAGSLAGIGGLVAGGFAFGFIGSATFLVSALLAYVSFGLSFRLLRLAPARPSDQRKA